MRAVFVELPAFERHRAEYLDDDSFGALQDFLGKGKRGGLRVIYYWWDAGSQFWLFTLYGKSEMADLSPQERRELRSLIKAELDARKSA